MIRFHVEELLAPRPTPTSRLMDHGHSLTSYSISVESGLSPLSTGILYGRLQRVAIPEAVTIQYVLLKMSKVLLETC